jgi:hypothetical protein
MLNRAALCPAAYMTVPNGLCRRLVVWLAWIYFVSWCSFPVVFVLVSVVIAY